MPLRICYFRWPILYSSSVAVLLAKVRGLPASRRKQEWKFFPGQEPEILSGRVVVSRFEEYEIWRRRSFAVKAISNLLHFNVTNAAHNTDGKCVL